MLKVKYLMALVLVALCVSLVSGIAFAQDSWAINLWDDDDDATTPDVAQVDLPIGMGWGDTYDATVGALNDGTTTWTKAAGYQLLSVEGTTDVGLVLTDRWGMPAVDLAGTDAIAPDDAKVFEFTLTAPPISGNFDSNWVMGATGIPIETALASPMGENADGDPIPVPVLITRFPDTAGGTGGAWAAMMIEGCAGRLPFIVSGYADGFYRPVNKVTRDQMAVFVRRGMGIAQVFPLPATYDAGDDEWTFFNTFPDVPYYGPGDARNNWAVGDVEALAAADATPDGPVVAGYGDGSYQPTRIVTRGQMAVYIARGAAVTQPTDDELTAITDPLDPTYDPEYWFLDVPLGYWSDNQIYALRDAGLVLGYADNNYRPGADVDRAQLAVYCYRAFIGTTTEAIVLGGPGLTNVDLTTTPTSHGWSSASVDPIWAYVEFDASAIGPELAGAGTWDIVFDFAAAETPTTVEDSAAVSLDAADLTGITGTYFTVAAKRPNMTPGLKIMTTTIEGKDGTPYKLARTVQFELLEPPPPPGAPRAPNGLGGTLWMDAYAAGGGDETRPDSGEYFSGSFANMKVADDSYYVLHQKEMPMDQGDWSDCCASTGFTLKWTGLEIPVGATEMKLTLEYHGGGTDDDANAMPCDWCSEPNNNMCEEWGDYNDDPLDPPLDLVHWIDGVHVNYGYGLVMVNFADAMDWDGSLTGSPGAEIQDTVAEGGFDEGDGVVDFAYHPWQTDKVMTWTISDWTNFVSADGTAAIHFCAYQIPYLYIDECMLEFNPH